jgi:hypothetical protein
MLLKREKKRGITKVVKMGVTLKKGENKVKRELLIKFGRGKNMYQNISKNVITIL